MGSTTPIIGLYIPVTGESGAVWDTLKGNAQLIEDFLTDGTGSIEVSSMKTDTGFAEVQYKMLPQAVAPANDPSYGQFYVDQTTGLAHYVTPAGVDRAFSVPTVYKSYSFAAPTTASGVFEVAGFYQAPAADANLTQASPLQTLGTANIAYGAHAFLVAAAAGTATGGTTGVGRITVTGTSVTDAGVKVISDSEVLVADTTAASTDQYFETTKKWIGQITYTLSQTGDRTSYAFDFNYGFAKYEDFGNLDFTVTDFEMVGLGGCSSADTGFNVELLHHASTGWTYHATAFVPGNGTICDLQTDYTPKFQIINNHHFAYKRSGLSQAVTGSALEGVIVRITTTQNNAVEYSDVHIGVRF